ncbi:DUF3899 domain-containing protein [Clostridiaceae bacterium M8S5]|nr:DUF3899 domain-containing protein [Clostridiaceae bacterium M8S5]
MIKRISIRIILGLFISLLLYILKILSMHSFSDILFIISLLFFTITGFQFVINEGLFDFQKYSLKQIKKIFFSWSANLFFINNSSCVTDDDNDITSDYIEFSEKHKKNKKDYKKNIVSNMIATLVLSIIAIIIS